MKLDSGLNKDDLAEAESYDQIMKASDAAETAPGQFSYKLQ